MSREEDTLLFYQRQIASLPLHEAVACQKLAKLLRDWAQHHGDVEALAIGLVGAELRLECLMDSKDA